MNQVGAPQKNVFEQGINAVKEFWVWLRTGCHNLKVAVITKYTRWADPKLAPYRPAPKQADSQHQNETKSSPTAPEIQPAKDITPLPSAEPASPVPATTGEFLDLMRRMPESILTKRERHVIATIMNFAHVKVSHLMLDKSKITYVHDDEVLGPLTLDRLYRSGFQHFPVLNYDRHVIGLIHTTALNSLEIKETSRAIEILDPKVCYLREDYTLNQALAAFIRTNCYFFLVIDRYERIVGMLTYQMLMDFLLGETPTDDFDRDSNRAAVAKR